MTGPAMLMAGLAVTVRLARWRGLSTWRESFVFILHVGYAWLVVGLMIIGANAPLEFMLPFAALHALTICATGTMTPAMITPLP